MKKVIFTSFLCLINSVAYCATSIDINTPKTITADKIEYDLNTDTIKTSGETEITNTSGQRMTLTDSYITKDGSSLSGNDIQLWLGNHVYIESDNIIREGADTIATDATFTCIW